LVREVIKRSYLFIMVACFSFYLLWLLAEVGGI